jgi:hypothetical protein
MGAKLSILRHAFVVIGAIAISEAAVAQPALSSNWWNSNLSFNRCMDATSSALKELGFTHDRFTTAVGGNYGDYATQVICATTKGVIIVIVSGPDGATVKDHLQSITQKIQNTR